MIKTNPKVLVVGANGYIGSHLSQRLIDAGYDVILSDIGENSLVSSANYQQIDFTDIGAIEGLVSGIDVIYFFAGKTGNSKEGFNSPDEFIAGNEITLVNLLNVIKDLPQKPRVVFPSTRLLYEGNNNKTIDEKSAVNPKSIYAINKLACEKYLEIYHANYDIEYAIFRISLPYGSFVPQKRISYGVMSYLINRAKNGSELFVYGEGKQKGSLIHISDLVNILIGGGLDASSANELYNVGGPDSLEMGNVVESIAGKFDVPVSKVDWPEISKNTDQGDLVFNSQKILDLLNYRYEHSFTSWLSQTEL